MSEDGYHRALQAGEWLFREGAAGDCAYLIESGAVEVSRDNGVGIEVLAHLGAGELLGEMALIDGGARTASVKALTPVRLRMITPDQLAERVEAADSMLRLMLKVVLRRYRDSLSPGQSAPASAVEDRDRRRVLERIRLEQELEQGLSRGEFVLHYQPIVSLSEMRTAGFEALIRWQSPSRGFVSPADFIPVAEESSLIVRIGAWALGESCAALKRLQAGRGAAGRRLFVTVNLSSRQLSAPALFDQVVSAASAAELAPECVKLELTESLLMSDFQRSTLVLERLRSAGFRVVLDDFGTGYSSLSYLHRFPVDTLKVDRSFVASMLENENSRKIVGAIGALAHALQMDVVAEGVETAAQAAALRALGFEYGQGYVFSRNVAETEMGALAERRWELPRA